MYNQNHLQNNDKIEISDETRIYIIDNLVEPYYKNIIKNTIDGRSCWRKTGITFETISKIMVAFGSILSFSAGFYHDDTLSFISGSISCLSLAFLQLSSFSYKENKKQSEELNILLKKLNLDTIPVFERQAETQMRQYQSSRPASMPNFMSSNPYNPPYNHPYNPHNTYNPYDPYNLHDKHTDDTYTPPLRSMPMPMPMPIPIIPSRSRIPKRASSIYSLNRDIPEEEIMEEVVEEKITEDTTKNNLDENNLDENNIDENNIDKNNIDKNNIDKNNLDENNIDENNKKEDNPEVNLEDKQEENKNETQSTDTNKSTFLQKTVKYLFN